MNPPRLFSPYQPYIGCFLLLVSLSLMCLLPLFLIDAAQSALQKLHLSSTGALLVLVGIFLGGLVNLPLYVLERPERPTAQPMVQNQLHILMGWVPIIERLPTRTIVAVNVGGCLIPAGLAVFEAIAVCTAVPQASQALAAAAGVNIVVCYFVARPVPGVGIAMPAFTSPLVSVLATWLLVAPDEFSTIRAPVAFVAGVAGPLIGADLLHLRDVTKIPAPMLSIGGAGTFDGIVLSGLLAAFLA